MRASLNGNSCRTHACFARQSGTCGEADSALNIANLGLAKLDKAQNVLSYRELLGLAEFEAWGLALILFVNRFARKGAGAI